MRCFNGKIPRRSFLGLGIAAGLSVKASSANPVPRRGRAKQVLIVFEQGGMSQMDTWDPKPEAFAEHRSPFKPIDTSAAGIQFTELLGDMHERGLLDETLVSFVTEFGRTPKLNKFQGRDHWTNAYSIVFAGAGVQGGKVIGYTDRDGGFVQDRPHTPEDYAATIYEFLGNGCPSSSG